MKKYLLSFAVLLMGMAMFTSCSEDEEDVTPGSTPMKMKTTGIYVINQGNEFAKISGSITGISTKNWNATQNFFELANGRKLGMTPNDAIIYGSRMYIAVSAEGTVEVVDKNTMKSVKQVKITDLLGSKEGYYPRHLASADGCVYVTTFGGYVAAIDTVSLSLKKKYQVGSYPEGITVRGNKLYVANSDFGRGKGNLSEINLTNGTVASINDPLVVNPSGIKAVSKGLLVLDSGKYDEKTGTQQGAGVIRFMYGKAKKVVDATMMAVMSVSGKPHRIYTINAPYTKPATPVTYQVYDMHTGKTSTFIKEGVDSPAAIAVDPVSGYVYITSYKKSPDKGSADYSTPGYVNIYDESGVLLKTLPTGVGPGAIVFDHHNVMQ